MSNNAAHALNAGTEASEDFFGMALSSWLTDAVEKRHTLWTQARNVAEHASLDGWGAVSVARAYTRSGSLWTMPLTCPSVGVEDEPDHGRHTCEWISEVAATRTLHDALMGLADRSGADNRNDNEGPGWLFSDETLWFDPTSPDVRAVVERYEFADLVVHEDYIGEIEADYVRQVSWPQWLDTHENVFDSHVSRDRLYGAYLGYEVSPCTSCQVGTKPGDIADQIMRTCASQDCDIWTDSRRQVCEYCDED